jgi:hypothetical protein
MNSRCPTCNGLMPQPAFTGRPRIFCSDACRREMHRRRQRLGELDTEIADARLQVRWGYRQHYWRRRVTALIAERMTLRRRTAGRRR